MNGAAGSRAEEAIGEQAVSRVLPLLGATAAEAALIVALYGSGYLSGYPYISEVVMFGVIPFATIAMCAWILSRQSGAKRWAISVALGFLGLYAGMYVALNTWGS